MNEIDYLKEITKLRNMTENPQVIAYAVREWDCTEKAGLRDFCWVLCRDDSYATENDAVFLLDELEDYLNVCQKKI